MFQIFKRRISPIDASRLVADLALDLREGYLSTVYAGTQITSVVDVRRELLFLGVYLVDGYIKGAPDRSWRTNAEGVLYPFYSHVTSAAGERHDPFMTEMLTRTHRYNQGLMSIAGEFSDMSGAARTAAISISMGTTFAGLVGDASNQLWRRIGAGAVLAMDAGTNRLFGTFRVR